MLSEVKNKIPPCPAQEVCKDSRQAREHSAEGVLLSFNGTRHCKDILMALGFKATAVIQKISLGYYPAAPALARQCFRENPQAASRKL